MTLEEFLPIAVQRSFDAYWVPRLKYLDSIRVERYLRPGGIIDNWVGIIEHMSDHLENLQIYNKQVKIDVSYNMEFRQDIPQFSGQKRSRTSRKY